MNGNNWCKSETFGPVLGDCIGIVAKNGNNFIGSWAWNGGDVNEKNIPCD